MKSLPEDIASCMLTFLRVQEACAMSRASKQTRQSVRKSLMLPRTVYHRGESLDGNMLVWINRLRILKVNIAKIEVVRYACGTSAFAVFLVLCVYVPHKALYAHDRKW